MRLAPRISAGGLAAAMACASALVAIASEPSTNSPVASGVDNTLSNSGASLELARAEHRHRPIPPGVSRHYSGPEQPEQRRRGQGDRLAGLVSSALRLWRGAEAHVDGLMWQGFGLSKTLGVEGFPNGEAFRLGTDVPNVNIARLFIRQTIGLGGEQETVEDDQLQLAGKQDMSRVTLTVGQDQRQGHLRQQRLRQRPPHPVHELGLHGQ